MIDPAAAAKANLDWELGRGKPVMLGITYEDTNINDDKITDHWVIATHLAGRRLLRVQRPRDR